MSDKPEKSIIKKGRFYKAITGPYVPFFGECVGLDLASDLPVVLEDFDLLSHAFKIHEIIETDKQFQILEEDEIGMPDLTESKNQLVNAGYDPDEIAEKGVLFVQQLIKNANLQSEITRLKLERDSFAIGFLDWQTNNGWFKGNKINQWINTDENGWIFKTTADLLELYKQSLLNG